MKIRQGMTSRECFYMKYIGKYLSGEIHRKEYYYLLSAELSFCYFMFMSHKFTKCIVLFAQPLARQGFGTNTQM